MMQRWIPRVVVGTVLSVVIVSSSAFSIADQKLRFRPQKPTMNNVILATTTTADGTKNGADNEVILDPKLVSSRVFATDQRPVILFDGGE